MEYEGHVEQLLTQGALEEDESGRLVLTRPFLDVVEGKRELLEEGEQEWYDPASDAVTEEGMVPDVLDLGWKQSEFLVHFLALSSFTGERLDREWLRTTAVLAQLREPRPRADGAPKAFLPIHGDWLDVFMELFQNAIVYFWRDDCDPCDVMVEEFDDIFDEPDGLALFAVYGPAHPRLLQEEYDITGGPATMFVVDGEVDTRLYGAQYRNVIDTEIETVREIAAE